MSFLIIIILLVSFNFFSFSFFRDNIRNEIIQYNNANLKNTTDSFEKHFQLVNNIVLGLYYDDKVQLLLNNKSINYNIASQVRRNIQNIVHNPLLYMDNVVMYFEDSSFILEKSGSTRAETMFTKFYHSEDYPYDFWRNEFSKNYMFRIYSASTFSEITFKNVSSSKGKLFPIIVKNQLYPNLYIVAFADVDKITSAYHRSINDNFYILNDKGTRIFALNNIQAHDLPAFDYTHSFVKKGKYYYFYKKGISTGLTYVNVIPDENISSQIARLNFTLGSLLIVAVAISLITSILFTMRINSPVKQIIESIQHFKTHKGTRSSIKEFDMISESVSHMIKTNQDIHEDLTNKNSLLRHYAYTNKLKKIHNNFQDLKDLFAENKPFIFILFQLKFKNRFLDQIDTETDRATYFVREYISRIIAQKFVDTFTFQIENDQILSLVFADDCETDLIETLENLKRVFDLDKDYCLLTIAVSSQYNNATEFTSAYEQVVKLNKQRKLIDETQIILKNSDQDLHDPLTSALEQEFDTYLHAGNDAALIQFVHRILSQMDKQNAKAADFYQFGEQISKKVTNALITINLDREIQLNDLYNQLINCYNLQQLEQFIGQLLTDSAGLIKRKKEDRDHIISFVIDHIETAYFEDITLDTVAEKMNITGGYLSSYFKEKTGGNFTDYLHEVRIRKTKEILLQSNKKIQDIATQVGYLNMNSFNRMFKKYTGQTPSDFRNTNHS
jgi:two-component system, response regulator YesN